MLNSAKGFRGVWEMKCPKCGTNIKEPKEIVMSNLSIFFVFGLVCAAFKNHLLLGIWIIVTMVYFVYLELYSFGKVKGGLAWIKK